MKKYILILVLLFSVLALNAQVAINNTGEGPVESAILDVQSTDKGMLIPRMEITDVDSDLSPVESPAEGLLIYNIGTTDNIPKGFYYWSNARWNVVTSGDGSFTVNQQMQMYEAGELYEDNEMSTPSSITLSNSSTYYGWVNADEGELFGNTTTNLSSSSGDKIIAGQDGLYKVELAVSFAGSNNFDLEIAVFVTPAATGVAGVTKIRAFRRIAANDVGSVSTHGLIRLLEGDALDMRFKGSTWGESVSIYNSNFIVNKVGE